MKRSVNLILLILSGMLLLSTVCCCGPRAPKRDFTTEVLLLDETVFPTKTTAGPITSNPDRHGARESLGRSIYHPSGLAGHDIYRYTSARGAAREFERQMDLSFRGGDWTVPAEIAYQSPTADQFYLACGTSGNIPMCRVIAQYEEYFVRLNVHMRPTFMTYADLESVLQAMDDRMTYYLAGGDQ